MTAPVTHAPEDMASLKGALCQCSRCGTVAEPSWRFDFFVLPPIAPGKPLLCESCLYVSIATTRTTLHDPRGAA